jgi:hypothetical protein
MPLGCCLLRCAQLPAACGLFVIFSGSSLRLGGDPVFLS